MLDGACVVLSSLELGDELRMVVAGSVDECRLIDLCLNPNLRRHCCFHLPTVRM